MDPYAHPQTFNIIPANTTTTDPNTSMPSNPSGLSAVAPSSPLRSVSLGSYSNGNNASSTNPTHHNSGGATPPRKTIPIINNTHPQLPPSSQPATSGSKIRARDLLRKHYGLGVGPPPSRATSDPSDPMDLNSAAFDAKSYYEQLITTSSLPTLIKRENELASEIRQLDSERQSLVYNHHHELIAASDTIGAMKAHAESLDADLDLLKAAFSEISRLSSEVSLEFHDEPFPSGQNHGKNQF